MPLLFTEYTKYKHICSEKTDNAADRQTANGQQMICCVFCLCKGEEKEKEKGERELGLSCGVGFSCLGLFFCLCVCVCAGKFMISN